MTNAPADLLGFRQSVMALTGLTDPVEVGIVGNDAHGVGYHVGVQTIKNRGNYPDGDYSTRQLRDRVGGDAASAMDIGDNWPKGGRAAWLRFGNLVYQQLRANDPALSAIRAINFSPDGSAKKRYDTFNRSQGLINSTDTVDIHTHLEFWRNTDGNRAATFNRLTQIMSSAIHNTPLSSVEGVDMTPGESQALMQTAQRVEAILKNMDSRTQTGTAGVFATEPNGLKIALANMSSASVNVQALADALAPLLPDNVSAADLVIAMQDPAVQAQWKDIVVQGAQEAEDS